MLSLTQTVKPYGNYIQKIVDLDTMETVGEYDFEAMMENMNEIKKHQNIAVLNNYGMTGSMTENPVKDAKRNVIYLGDVLYLEFTEKLLNDRGGFSNSNYGKYVERKRQEGKNLTGVYFMMDKSRNFSMYEELDKKLQWNESKDDIKSDSFFDADTFFQYLVAKGAYVVGNIFLTPDLLNEKLPTIQEHEKTESDLEERN